MKPETHSNDSGPRKVRVLLADDHAILREGLTALINTQPDMRVVAQAEDGEQALTLAREYEPDVAVLDISMQKMTGAEAAEKLAQSQPAVRTLALTRHSDVAYLYRVLQAGARGYVLKQTAADGLINAIRVVANGGTYVDPALADTLVEHSLNARDFDRKAAVGVTLTPRECEVLSLVAWGRSNKEIAAKLEISIKTVESYKATAVAKLHLRNRSEILRYALSRGWLRDDRAPD